MTERLHRVLRHGSHVLRGIVFTVAVTAMPAHARDPVNVLGDWKLVAVLDGVEISSIDENEANRLRGRVMTIGRDGTRFGEQRCGPPSLNETRVEPNLYIAREAKISARKLHLPNPVTVVDIGCTEVFLKSPRRAVIFWDGFFFLATKVR